MAGNVPLLVKSWPKIFKQQLSRKSWGGGINQLCRFSPQKIVNHCTLNKINAHIMDGGDCDAAIAAAGAAVTNVQSLSHEVGSGDEGLGLFGL